MQISYSRPLSQAWAQMTGLLFRPFDLGRWFVLGFTAFLAGLVGGDGADSGELERDGAVVRTEDIGPDAGGDEPRAQDP